MFDPWTTSGGKALPFRLDSYSIKEYGTNQRYQKRYYWYQDKAQVIKNRLGSFEKCRFPLFFDKGIDDYGSWLTVMKDHKLVKQAGAWYTFVDKMEKNISSNQRLRCSYIRCRNSRIHL